MALFKALTALFRNNKEAARPAKRLDWNWPVSLHADELVTPDTSMTVAAVYRAIAFISQSIGMLPWSVYENYTPRSNDPVHYMLHDRPCPEMGAMSFKETLIKDALGWGNGYAVIESSKAGLPIGMWRRHPSRVQVMRTYDGYLFYRYKAEDGSMWDLDPAQVFHLKGLGDGIVGESIIGCAARTIASAMSSAKYNNNLFKNQAVPSFVLEHPRKLSEEAYSELKGNFANNYAGAVNAGKPIILEDGMKASPLSMKPEDIQFLESRKFAVEEIACWFGLPPHKLADLSHATFSNIEHQSQEVVNDALMPWIKKLEEEANYKLLGIHRGDLYTKINVTSLLRGDFKSRMEGYRTGIICGMWSVNDCRRWEDTPSIPGGDQHLVQMQMVPLEDAGKHLQKEQSPITENETRPEEDNGVQDTGERQDG